MNKILLQKGLVCFANFLCFLLFFTAFSLRTLLAQEASLDDFLNEETSQPEIIEQKIKHIKDAMGKRLLKSPYKIHSIIISKATAVINIKESSLKKNDVLLIRDAKSLEICKLKVLTIEPKIAYLDISKCKFKGSLKKGDPLALKKENEQFYSKAKPSFVGAWFAINNHLSQVANATAKGAGYQGGFFLNYFFNENFRTIIDFGIGKQGAPETATSDLQTYRTVTMGSASIVGGPNYLLLKDKSLILQPFAGLNVAFDEEQGAVVGGLLKYNGFGIGPVIGLRLYFLNTQTSIDLSYSTSLLAESFTERRPTESFDYIDPTFNILNLSLHYDLIPWEHLSTYIFYRSFKVASSSRTGIGSSVAGSLDIATSNFGVGITFPW